MDSSAATSHSASSMSAANAPGDVRSLVGEPGSGLRLELREGEASIAVIRFSSRVNAGSDTVRLARLLLRTTFAGWVDAALCALSGG